MEKRLEALMTTSTVEYPLYESYKIHDRSDWWCVRTYVGKRIFFAHATTKQEAAEDVKSQVEQYLSEKKAIVSPFV